MPEDPLGAINSFAERAYVRMQAGEMLLYCLEKEDTAPMQTLVEELVLVGPQSLNTLREVLAEVNTRKSQLDDDLHQLFSDLDQKLKGFGVVLSEFHNPQSLISMNTSALLSFLGGQGITDESEVSSALQVLRNTQELMATLVRHLRLLYEIEMILRDWLWSLMYQFAQQVWVDIPASGEKSRLLL